MSTPPNRPPAATVDSEVGVRPLTAPPRPLLWSVRRELWEHRSIVIAPLAVTAVVLFASLIATLWLPGTVRRAAGLAAGERHDEVVGLLSAAPAPIMLAALLVGFVYSLDALYGERRDRSILFWKSLPVSDRITVLAKASVPVVVLPLFALALSLVAFVTLLVAGSLVLAASGVRPTLLWSEVRFVQEPLVMVYGLAIHSLWFAPIHGWLLLVSAWARRVPVLWAGLPPLALAVVERIALGTTNVCTLLGDRFSGAMARGFAPTGGHHVIDRLAQLTPARFVSSPDLWVGLAFAVACLALAVRLRRHREPI